MESETGQVKIEVMSHNIVTPSVICSTCKLAFNSFQEIEFVGLTWQHKIGYGKCGREATPMEYKHD